MCSFLKMWKLRKLFAVLRKADGEQLELLFRYILRLYEEQYPDVEFVLVTLPKADSLARKGILEAMCRIYANKMDSLG